MKEKRLKRSKEPCGQKKRMRFRPLRFVFFLFLLVFCIASIGYCLLSPSTRHEIKRVVHEQLEGCRRLNPLPWFRTVWERVNGTEWVACPESGYEDGPLFGGCPASGGRRLTLLKNTAYWVGYDEERCSPAWVAYRLVRNRDTEEVSSRPPKFMPDYRTEAAITSDWYTRSGYVRGHLAPNYGIAKCYGKDAQLETFLMTNVVPQSRRLNSGIWQALERKELNDYANDYGAVWIVAGPVYPPVIHQTLPSGLPVPDGFFKILLIHEAGRVRSIAFFFRQESDGPVTLRERIVSIDDVEAMTSLDFFPLLPQELQDKLEMHAAHDLW